MPATTARRPSLCNRKTVEKMSTVMITTEENVCLPKLPVPNLMETLEQYLLCVKPLVTSNQFEKTKAIVEEFGREGGIGEIIQEKLIERAQKKTNWASEWWLKDMYLNCRAALPVNSNPGMVWPKKHFKDETSWLRYAAKLTTGILDFKVILDARALPIDIARGQLSGQPLCMEQYYRLLNSYRLPGYECDNLVSFPPPNNEPQHIVVACNNQFFIIPVSVGNYRLTEADFTRQFGRIIKEASSSSKQQAPVGCLTAINRSDWAEARELLIEDPLNRASLDAMERCIFVLCLDQTTGALGDVSMAHQMLHGSGPELNSCNRWYDKTIQLIISRDGVTGLCYEHSASEGIAVIALIEHLLKYISLQESKGMFRSSSTTELPVPCRLYWNVEKNASEYVEAAQRHTKNTAETLDLEVFRFNNYGKNFIKKQSISPDAYIQVALQITYYKLYKRLVSTYESASVRRFREGRVDNIRAASVQALELAKGLTEPDTTGKIRLDARKMLLLRRAIKAQTDFTISAITGHGIDSHLLGLKMMAEEMGLPVPELYSDPSYDLCNYFQLSTSQIPTTMDSFMCYGAVVPDGYGTSYNPHDDSMVFCVSSFRNCPSTSSSKFVNALEESLLTMKKICEQWNKRRSSSLERIHVPTKLSLQRRVRVLSTSSEGNSLRDDFSPESESSEENRDNSEGKQDYFLSHCRTRCTLKAGRSGTRALVRHSNRPDHPNKLNRRFSDIALRRPPVLAPPKSSKSIISADLLEVLKQENMELI